MAIETTAGYFSFKEIIEDGEKALDAKLYRIALMLALIIPSVCSRVEFKDNARYKDESGRWKDRDCYVDWCLLQNIKFLDAEEKYGNVDESRLNEDYCQHIYEIRCGVVHESAVQCDNVVCNLCANDNRAICKEVNCDKANQYDICVVPFCKQMFEIGKRYCENHQEQFDLAKIPMRLYEFE
jgi:hypothetical protein